MNQIHVGWLPADKGDEFFPNAPFYAISVSENMYYNRSFSWILKAFKGRAGIYDYEPPQNGQAGKLICRISTIVKQTFIQACEELNLAYEEVTEPVQKHKRILFCLCVPEDETVGNLVKALQSQIDK